MLTDCHISYIILLTNNKKDGTTVAAAVPSFLNQRGLRNVYNETRASLKRRLRAMEIQFRLSIYLGIEFLIAIASNVFTRALRFAYALARFVLL